MTEINSLINADYTIAKKNIYSGLKCFAKITPNGYIDGDTIRVIFFFNDLLVENKIRLLGINAPESRTHDLIEKEKGIASKKYLENICKTNEHNIVYIECGEYDAFGRILANVYQVYFSATAAENEIEPFNGSRDIFKSKKSLNAIMLEKGYAKAFYA